MFPRLAPFPPFQPCSKQPVLRDRLFYGTITIGLLHGFSLMFRSTGEEEETFLPPPASPLPQSIATRGGGGPVSGVPVAAPAAMR